MSSMPGNNQVGQTKKGKAITRQDQPGRKAGGIKEKQQSRNAPMRGKRIVALQRKTKIGVPFTSVAAPLRDAACRTPRRSLDPVP